MKTDDLIKSLSADAPTAATPMGRAWGAALAGSILLSAVVFFMLLGPRSDISEAMGTIRFPFKFVVAIVLGLTAWQVARTIAMPDGNWRGRAVWLLAAPTLLVVAAMVEVSVLPADERMSRMIGTNSMLCLTAIPAIGLLPLAVLLAAMRHGAPSRPGIAGAMSGILAGGIAATLYAAHCIDDSPLFVATWYTIAILLLALLGAAAGSRLLRW